MNKLNDTANMRPPAAFVDPYARLVALPVHAENIFHFPDGLPAFEDAKEFVFLCKPDTRPFFFMKSITQPGLSFVCIDPFLIYPDYTPHISDTDTKFLHLNSMKDVLLVSIVTISSNVQETTANLQGPIVINIQACICKQIICDRQNYPVRFRIWDALNKSEASQQSTRDVRNHAMINSRPQ